jgi:hypothetical protein
MQLKTSVSAYHSCGHASGIARQPAPPALQVDRKIVALKSVQSKLKPGLY